VAAARDRRGELSGDRAGVPGLTGDVARQAADVDVAAVGGGQDEYHLRRVFLKLGVSSRAELANLPLAPVAVGAADLTPGPLLACLVVYLRAGSIVLHRLDSVQSRMLTLISLAGRNYLTVGSNQVEVILATRTFLRTNLPAMLPPLGD
jgi:hypothetical protein